MKVEPTSDVRGSSPAKLLAELVIGDGAGAVGVKLAHPEGDLTAQRR